MLLRSVAAVISAESAPHAPRLVWDKTISVPEERTAPLSHRHSCVVFVQLVRTFLQEWLTPRGVRPRRRTTAPRKKAACSSVSPAPRGAEVLLPPALCWATPTTPTRPTSQTAGKVSPPARAWVTAPVTSIVTLLYWRHSGSRILIWLCVIVVV